MRKLSPSLRQAYFYCWDKADACGVYEHDPLYMKADLGFALSVAELKKLPGVNILSGDRIFFTDFILTNYGTLKEGYNPHKPVFRALEKNKISSLLEACTKLEEEEEGEEEDEDEGKEEKEKRQKIELVFPYNSPEFMQMWGVLVKEPFWKKKSKTALQAVLKKLSNYPERDAIQMMEEAIAGAWKNVYELKTQNNGNRNTGKTEYGTPERAAEYERLFSQRYGGGGSAVG